MPLPFWSLLASTSVESKENSVFAWPIVAGAVLPAVARKAVSADAAGYPISRNRSSNGPAKRTSWLTSSGVFAPRNGTRADRASMFAWTASPAPPGQCSSMSATARCATHRKRSKVRSPWSPKIIHLGLPSKRTCQRSGRASDAAGNHRSSAAKPSQPDRCFGTVIPLRVRLSRCVGIAIECNVPTILLICPSSPPCRRVRDSPSPGVRRVGEIPSPPARSCGNAIPLECRGPSSPWAVR